MNRRFVTGPKVAPADQEKVGDCAKQEQYSTDADDGELRLHETNDHEDNGKNMNRQVPVKHMARKRRRLKRDRYNLIEYTKRDRQSMEPSTIR